MKLVDLNLLLYAINQDAPHHPRARAWWERTLAEDETIGLAWTVLLGFVRISTRFGVFPRPLSCEQALEVVDGWIAHPLVVPVHPGERHWPVLHDLLMHAGTAGNLTTDAHLAALAIEYGATLLSTDNDFHRFRPALSFRNPLS